MYGKLIPCMKLSNVNYSPVSRESRRKTPVAVSIKDNERLFSDGALAMVGISTKIVFCLFLRMKIMKNNGQLIFSHCILGNFRAVV